MATVDARWYPAFPDRLQRPDRIALPDRVALTAPEAAETASRAASAPLATPAAAPAATAPSPAAEDEPGFSFGRFLDIVNPLHHLPVVGTIYRAITGDTIADADRLAGSTLFGGPVGFLLASASLGVEELTGHTPEGWVLSAFDSGPEAPDAPATAPATAVAAAPAAVAAPAPAPAVSAPSPVVPAQAAAGPAIPELSAAAFDTLLQGFAMPGATAAPTSEDEAARPAGAARALGADAVGAAAAAPITPAGAGPQPADFAAHAVRALDAYQAMLKARAAGMP